MGAIQDVKSNRGTVRVTSDRSKKPNAGEGPRFSVAVNVYGYDLWGEGDTKEAATRNALDMLPAHVRRHFP